MKANHLVTFVGTLILGGLIGLVVWNQNLTLPLSAMPRVALSNSLFQREIEWQRPYGMAPQAFEAYLTACRQAGVSPARIGQTIGDHPRSVGYHKRDGIVKVGGETIEYTAAVDLAAFELPEWQRQKFLRALAKNGFAAWYRSGPRWKNGEHIHAIYASLPMKPQLRGQVTEWLRDRRIARQRPYAWETALRCTHVVTKDGHNRPCSAWLVFRTA
jgi:hypothetical protein